MRALLIAAHAEAVSLVILLTNLFTVHTQAITSLGGPVHGTAYLIAIVSTWRMTASPGARWRAWIPGVGGLLAVRCLRRLEEGAAAVSPASEATQASAPASDRQ
ncbi:DUF3817 domain-containing protein [Streptomyces boninensis]|uniref:DUF3817 domain-containing protein n=1 Tax=Streptomyces boninensis TaxID=2039455 RepID=UPI003B218B6C